MTPRPAPAARVLSFIASLALASGARAQAPPPEQVLRGWAQAIEQRDWRAVRALWGHGGADSGLSPGAFAARWRHVRRPRVVVAPGTAEGAAGSVYYTATVTVRDGRRRFAAPVTLRRVNGVDGATPEQLRWHFDVAVREPWTRPR